jgi:YD repeat-containing protein
VLLAGTRPHRGPRVPGCSAAASPQPPSRPGPQPDCLIGNGTSFCGYDAFGRPHKIVTADGKSTTLDYKGLRIVKRTVPVWDATRNGEVLQATREEYDGLGRLKLVKEPNGTMTRYTYDVGGRLTGVVTRGSDGAQPRSFSYDGRGFLTSELHPEVGLPGAKEADRETAYQYDARGNLTYKQTPTWSLHYHYDAAGRLTGVGTESDPQKDLRHLVYANGKLSQAKAYNDRMVGGACTRFQVLQDFSYDPNHGRLKDLETRLQQQAVNFLSRSAARRKASTNST